MALFVFCVIWETIGSLRCGASFYEKWVDTEYPKHHTEEHHSKDEEHHSKEAVPEGP
jgi:hypothetical protein